MVLFSSRAKLNEKSSFLNLKASFIQRKSKLKGPSLGFAGAFNHISWISALNGDGSVNHVTYQLSKFQFIIYLKESHEEQSYLSAEEEGHEMRLKILEIKKISGA